MPRYNVEYRYPDGEEPIVIGPYEIEAQSLHDAIGTAWGLMKREVEMYGGTIDDLDGYELTPPSKITASKDYREGYAQALRDTMPGLTGPSRRYVERLATDLGIELEED